MSRLYKLAFAALVLLAPQATTAAELNCENLTTTPVIAVTALTTTSSTTPVNVSGAVTTQTFSNPGCVVVEFSGQVKAPAPNSLRLSIQVTGSSALTAPRFYLMNTSGTRLDGRAVVFVFPDLQCGCTLQLKVQSLNGSPVSIGQGVMRVYYNNDV